MGKFNQLEQAISDTLDDAFGDAKRSSAFARSTGHREYEIDYEDGDECILEENLPALKADIMKRLKELLS